MKGLNLGCGKRYHPAWTNVDMVFSDAHVRSYDLRRGIPFPDATFDVVYQSHLLEHFRRCEAETFLRECYRVLKDGGIIRVVVPDLERIARLYLDALEEASQGREEWQHHYEWMMLELYDQAVRERSGGRMLEYVKQDVIPNEEFVRGRIGDEMPGTSRAHRDGPNSGGGARVRLRRPFRCVRRLLLSFRGALARALLGSKRHEALRIGRFRGQGEVHHWMYDRYSLGRLLLRVGFRNAEAVGPTESQVPGWTGYCLDSGPDGRVYKPDSLCMEAVKPDTASC